jgi:hypothetical protein
MIVLIEEPAHSQFGLVSGDVVSLLHLVCQTVYAACKSRAAFIVAPIPQPSWIAANLVQLAPHNFCVHFVLLIISDFVRLPIA